jgi:hypothetical protein
MARMVVDALSDDELSNANHCFVTHDSKIDLSHEVISMTIGEVTVITKPF